jgi:hypothetical protein
MTRWRSGFGSSTGNPVHPPSTGGLPGTEGFRIRRASAPCPSPLVPSLPSASLLGSWVGEYMVLDGEQ